MNKYKIIILIQCRLSSSRLPAKALLPIGEYPSVVFCALRAASTGFPVIVATSTDKSDDILEQVLRRNNLQCFRGSLDDVLLRMTEAVAAYHDDDLVVRLTADNVFPDGNFINLVVSQFDESKFDYLGTSSPQDGLPYGLSTEVFKVSALREANRKANTPFDREHVTPYIKRHFRCKQFLLEHVPPSWQHLRCTMDTFDDYLRLLNLFKQIDSPLNTPWMELVKYLELSTKLGTVEKKRQEKRYENLVFGTAQLGLPYGVANQQGLPSEEQALALMQKAIKAGVMCFDTARAYGLSEQRIGKALKANSKEDIHVISKLHPLNYLSDEASDEQVRFAVKASIYETCYHLKLSKIDTLLLHRWEHRYQWREAVWDELISLKQDGVIKQIGVSVSTPVEVVEALQEPQIEHIQCPVNLLDWRWRQSEFLAAISKRKDVVFLHEVFISRDF